MGDRVSYPLTNAEEYWTAIYECWEDLVSIIGDQMDLNYTAYNIPGDASSEPTGRSIGEDLEYLKEKKDGKLVRYFNGAWGLASDNYAYSVHRWGLLCDLCSEEECIREEEPEEG